MQDFCNSDQAIIADTSNLAGVESERTAKPDTLAFHESPLIHLERVADKLHGHYEGHTFRRTLPNVVVAIH